MPKLQSVRSYLIKKLRDHSGPGDKRRARQLAETSGHALLHSALASWKLDMPFTLKRLLESNQCLNLLFRDYDVEELKLRRTVYSGLVKEIELWEKATLIYRIGGHGGKAKNDTVFYLNKEYFPYRYSYDFNSWNTREARIAKIRKFKRKGPSVSEQREKINSGLDELENLGEYSNPS